MFAIRIPRQKQSMGRKTGLVSMLSALLLLQLHLSLAQFAGCPMISDPDALSRLVADANNEDLVLQPFSVSVLRNHTVCFSMGREDGTFSSVSLLVQYECRPSLHPVCVTAANSSSLSTDPSSFSTNRSLITQQFDFSCKSKNSENQWSPKQFGGETGSHTPTADFDTPLRPDCSACIEKGVAERQGFLQLLHMDPVTRCLACSSGCDSAGMGRCFGVADTMCCNYFANGSCVNLCPHTTQPDSNFNCQRVVIGFEEKVYMVEEGQARLELPVVVKEGELTQRVTLFVTIIDGTTTVGEDYFLFNDRVRLFPNPRAGSSSGSVYIEIRDDSVIEDNEEFVVNLELKSGSSAALNISSTVILIMEDLMETEEPGTNATTEASTSPTLPIENGCEAEFDVVWGLNWPTAAQRTTATVSCGPDNKGIAIRKCLEGAVWAPANITFCENQVISNIGKMARELFDSPDVQVTKVLIVLRELADATSTIATATGMSQLPRDIETASNIVAKAVDLLLASTTGNNSIGSTQLEAVDVNETEVVVELLSLLLTDQNNIGFSSLQDEGSVNDSRAILNSAEKYSHYVGQVVVEDGSIPGRLNYSRDNLVFVSERRNGGEPELDVTFPRSNDLSNIVSEPKPPAFITIPGELLRDKYKGNVSITSLFFRDLHNLLPTNSTNGTVPRSFVISSEIYGLPAELSAPLVFDGTPITLSFTIELNDSLEVPNCVFWDFSKGVEGSGWSSEGLRTESVTREGNNVTVTCSSNHLTSFSVLVDVSGAKLVDKSLQIISYIGISISIACLFLTILFFASIGKKLFSTVHNFIHLNLSISLFVAYVIFGVGIEVATSNQSLCTAVAALIQYFLLAAFCWMMCEGIMLYLMLVVVFSRVSEKWWFFLLLGWGLPLIFVVIGLSSVMDEYGVRDDHGQLLYCWLSSGDGKHAIWTFVAPMLGIITVNSVFLVLVLRSIYISKSSQDSRSKKGQKTHSLVRYIVKASLILLPLLGLTWVFGLFAVNQNTAVFAWLFTIFNSLQGVSIFAFHVLRNDRVWGKFRKSVTDPDGFLRSFSTRMTTRSSVFMGSSRFSRQSEMEMRSHSVRDSTASALASYPAVVPSEDSFEPRVDSPSSGEQTGETTSGNIKQNGSTGLHTNTTTGEPNAGAPNGVNNGCSHDGATHNGESTQDDQENSRRDSEFLYQQLCDEITSAVNGATRKLSYTGT